MDGRKKLAGQRIAVLVTDGFEQVELSAPLLALKEAGAEADIVSLHTGHIRGVNLNEAADDAVEVDKLVTEVRARDYDGMFIPGGFINPDLLRQSSAARDLVREFDHLGKPIATLCHGPWLVASSGLAAGRAMTSWPGVRDDLVNAGAIWLDQKVVRDGNLLSSRGPQDIVPFVREMIQLYAGAPASNGALRRRRSDPQRDEPATFAATGMRVMPNLSVSTMLGMALLSAGAYAVRRGLRGPGGPGGTEGAR